MRLAIATTLALAALLAGSAGAAPVSRTDAVNDLTRRYVAGVILVASADNTMRQCDTNALGDCDLKAGTVKTDALIWRAAVARVSAQGLSPYGLRTRANAEEGFRRYYLAVSALEAGSFQGYVSQLKQAIAQEYAAGTRLGRGAWFNLVMAANGCSGWQVALRTPGMAPCD